MFSVIQCHQVQCAADLSDKMLKQQLNTLYPALPRRLDRLALLTLLAAAPFQNLAAETGLYLSSNYPALANMYALLDTVVVQQQLPKPFEFVNSVSNAASFYAAKMLQLNGPNLFIGAGPTPWQQLCELALADLHANVVPQALLLLVDQHALYSSAQAILLGKGSWQPVGWQYDSFAKAII